MTSYYKYDKYTVIIGDIIDSRKISDRKKFQSVFKETLENINVKYQEDLAAKFSITLGDEFQGLLKSKKNILNIIFDIEMALWPTKLRFGVGIGEISTEISYYNTAEIDGSAYHRARKMIDLLKSKEGQHSKRTANILIASNKENLEIDNILNSVLSVTTALKSKWTIRQAEIIDTYLKSEENQYQTASKLKIGQSSISKALSSANFITYQAALESVSHFLAQMEKNND